MLNEEQIILNIYERKCYDRYYKYYKYSLDGTKIWNCTQLSDFHYMVKKKY